MNSNQQGVVDMSQKRLPLHQLWEQSIATRQSPRDNNHKLNKDTTTSPLQQPTGIPSQSQISTPTLKHKPSKLQMYWDYPTFICSILCGLCVLLVAVAISPPFLEVDMDGDNVDSDFIMMSISTIKLLAFVLVATITSYTLLIIP